MNFLPQRARRAESVIDIAPLVDIVFQLLIFFLLTASFVTNPNMEINLPKASMEQSAAHGKELYVDVTKDGRILHERKLLDIKGLRRTLESTFAENPQTMILIRADKSSRHGRVVEVMDLAKTVGFSRLGIAVENKPGE